MRDINAVGEKSPRCGPDDKVGLYMFPGKPHGNYDPS